MRQEDIVINVKVMDDEDYRRNAHKALDALKLNRLIENAYSREITDIDRYIWRLEDKIRRDCVHSWRPIDFGTEFNAYRYTTATQVCTKCGICNDQL